jgi:putative transcriptional regulator
MSEIFDSIKKGLQEAIDYESGQLVTVKKQKVTVSPLPRYNAIDIKRIRTSLMLSQHMFSNVLGVSTKTIEAWESGRNVPQGPALRMLELMNKNPSIVKNYVTLTR